MPRPHRHGVDVAFGLALLACPDCEYRTAEIESELDALLLARAEHIKALHNNHRAIERIAYTRDLVLREYVTTPAS